MERLHGACCRIASIRNASDKSPGSVRKRRRPDFPAREAGLATREIHRSFTLARHKFRDSIPCRLLLNGGASARGRNGPAAVLHGRSWLLQNAPSPSEAPITCSPHDAAAGERYGKFVEPNFVDLSRSSCNSCSFVPQFTLPSRPAAGHAVPCAPASPAPRLPDLPLRSRRRWAGAGSRSARNCAVPRLRGSWLRPHSRALPP